MFSEDWDVTCQKHHACVNAKEWRYLAKRLEIRQLENGPKLLWPWFVNFGKILKNKKGGKKGCYGTRHRSCTFEKHDRVGKPEKDNFGPYTEDSWEYEDFYIPENHKSCVRKPPSEPFGFSDWNVDLKGNALVNHTHMS